MEHLVVKGADVPQEEVNIRAQRELTGAPKFSSSKPIFSGGPIGSEEKSHPVFRILRLPGNTAKDADNNLQSQPDNNLPRV